MALQALQHNDRVIKFRTVNFCIAIDGQRGTDRLDFSSSLLLNSLVDSRDTRGTRGIAFEAFMSYLHMAYMCPYHRLYVCALHQTGSSSSSAAIYIEGLQGKHANLT